MKPSASPPTDVDVQKRIVHVLEIYPVLSHSMLQIGLGMKLQSKVWRPVLQAMIEKGVIIREDLVIETPGGQHRPYTKLRLNSKKR